MELSKEDKISIALRGNKNRKFRKQSFESRVALAYKRLGENNPNWKEGETPPFTKIFGPGGKKSRKRLSRLIMEKYMGRPLTKYEVVYHIDGNIRNNLVENLKLLTRSQHIKLHFYSL